MQKLRVGVLRGGPSSEYDRSLQTGGHILKSLSEEQYTPQDIYISRSGVWHLRGFEVPPEKVLRQVDVVFNALHGEYGEDGTVQNILDTFRVPYTGSGTLASALAMNKSRAKDVVSQLGIRTPLSRVITREEKSDIEPIALELFRTFPQPVIIKPLSRGSSSGVLFADSFQGLIDALSQSLAVEPLVLVEEYIGGREVTSGVVKGFRGEDRYTFLPIEIELPKRKRFLDAELKASGGITAHCPGNLSAEEKLRIREATRAVHDMLGLGHYSRSDFILTPRNIYFLEANTQPDLSEDSLVTRALTEAGCAFPEFVEHVIALAVEKK